MEQIKICCFTGHRPQNLPFRFDEQDRRCRKLKRVLQKEILRQINEEGVQHFISGMAIGVDMYAAEIVLELKHKYPRIACIDETAIWWTLPRPSSPSGTVIPVAPARLSATPPVKEKTL